MPPPKFRDVVKTLPGAGWLTQGEAGLLYDAAYKRSGPILEIGSYQGRSTVLLAALGRPVYAVDPFDDFDDTLTGNEIHNRLKLNLESRGITNVEIFRQRCEDWKPRKVGFAYLDGDHTTQGTLNQIDVARECGAITVCIHDYSKTEGGVLVKDAVKQRPQLRRIKTLHSMAYFRVLG